jgi:hypothetical protein
MAHLVQILLPVFDSDGREMTAADFGRVRNELVERFGGATAYTRAPAEGVWDSGERTVRDDIVVVEVMTDKLDKTWWSDYRRTLERRFRQQVIVIRHHQVDLV